MNECGYCTRMVKMVIKKLIPFNPTTKKDWVFKAVAVYEIIVIVILPHLLSRCKQKFSREN